MGSLDQDGTIDTRHPLKESSSSSYLQRTEWNVRDSDATVLFSTDPVLSGGSRKTVEFARKHNKPCLHLHSRQPDAADRSESFLQLNQVHILNVAGARASKEPNVAQFDVQRALVHECRGMRFGFKMFVVILVSLNARVCCPLSGDSQVDCVD
jgi:Circularly permutated YpsA SLOG family